MIVPETPLITPDRTLDLITIPANYFYCPYWVLNVALFLIFVLGLIIGIGSIYGWKKLFLQIVTLVNRIL